jgi:hypothetical protein
LNSADIARRYYAFFNERRLDEAERLVDPYAVFHYVPTKQRLIGRAGYRALAAAWLAAFRDARLEIQSLKTEGAGIVHVEFLGHGTHTGELVLGEHLVIPPTERTTELPFRDRLTITDGLIVESELDFDVLELKKRLLGEVKQVGG